MGMVRSPKLIAGSVGLALGNAPYKISDRTASGAVGATLGNALYSDGDHTDSGSSLTVELTRR
jgi:hypothetical protein